ncbi:Hemerythrin HHE cation binding domain-containing protein [Pleurostoma richardsiae]|uniref:Hemerythrin HHE cation binding domain-containing protein n=1 Tax=Pleurostoma richardsiae TaxID=41990 RepID=A0AA38VNV8_9PEZI|nr:Hemerythrin HHE cation binding domain-containing protein [Pleurostoma richardsiae]
MAVFADHPFALITTPIYQARQKSKDYDPDVFDRVAADMACSHNMILRGLNAIYLQALHIKAEDIDAFLHFILNWSKELHNHHDMEEGGFFPVLEDMTGEKGVMDANIDQHRAFHGGMEALHAYVEGCVARTEEYDGVKVVKIIDTFGAILRQHLSDEIPTLLGLRRFGAEKMAAVEDVLNAESAKIIKRLGLFTGVSWGFSNHDVTYEGGLWEHWPPAPELLVFLVRNAAYHVHSDWWKFSSCDRYGCPRPLYAIPENHRSS